MPVEIHNTKVTPGNYSKRFKGQTLTCNRCQWWYYKYDKRSGYKITKTKRGWICDRCLDSQDL